MSLADELKVINEQQEAREENKVDYPSSHLKNNVLRLTKKTPKIVCRILPAVSADKPTWQAYREMWVTDNNGKYRSYMLASDARDENDPLLQAVKRWDKATFKSTDKNGNPKDVSGLYKLSKYGNFPGLKYYLNVIPLEVVNKNGVPTYTEVIKDGNYEVHMLSVNSRLLNTLATDLQDQMHNPNLLYKKQIDVWNQKPNVNFTQEQISNSFISDILAYPVVFNRIEGNPVTYSMELQQQRPLMPLNSSWKEQAEDLAYQATPSYEYNRHWVDDLITRIDHELGLDSHIEPPKQTRQVSNTNTASTAPKAQTQTIPQKQTPEYPQTSNQTNTTVDVQQSDPFAAIGMQDPFPSQASKVGVPDDTIDNGSFIDTSSDEFGDNPWDTTPPTANSTLQQSVPQNNTNSQTSTNNATPETDLGAIPEDDMPFDDDIVGTNSTVQPTPAPQAQSTAPKQEPQAQNNASQTIDSADDSKTVDDILSDIGIDKNNPLGNN